MAVGGRFRTHTLHVGQDGKAHGDAVTDRNNQLFLLNDRMIKNKIKSAFLAIGEMGKRLSSDCAAPTREDWRA